MQRQRDWIWVGVVLVAVLATYPFVRVSSDAPPVADRSGDGSGKGSVRAGAPKGLTVAGLWLGMNRSEVEQGLGKPAREENGFVVYARTGSISMVRVRFKEGLAEVVSGPTLEKDGVQVTQPGSRACEQLLGEPDHAVAGDGPDGGCSFYTWSKLGLTATVSSPPTPTPADWKGGASFQLSRGGR